jgi:hypothetical protein
VRVTFVRQQLGPIGVLTAFTSGRWSLRAVPPAAVVIGVSCLILALAPGVARATHVSGHYFGFNNLTVGSPTDCMAAWSPNQNHGCAHSGFNNNDWSEMTKNSGDTIALGFRDTSGLFYYLSYSYLRNGTTFHVTRTGLGAPMYNRAFCAYQGGASSYASCRAYVF